MSVVITYDVSEKHSAVKAAMISLGYDDKWADANGKWVHLPNTTLWKKDGNDLEAAIAELRGVSGKLGVALERAIAVPAYPWNGIFGIPHAQ